MGRYTGSRVLADALSTPRRRRVMRTVGVVTAAGLVLALAQVPADAAPPAEKAKAAKAELVSERPDAVSAMLMTLAELPQG
jgi:hypothetical protein